MKLYYWQGSTNLSAGQITKNFGDELNPHIFTKLIGDILDDSDSSFFIGIGTLLNENINLKLPPNSQKIIFGSGFGYGNKPIIDSRFSIYCVRGPLTAQLLGLNPSLAITDSAALLKILPHTPPEYVNIGFMPHWSNRSNALSEICLDMGIRYIDPSTSTTEQTLAEILSCKLLLTEAMHGAIVADTYRVPWIAIKTTSSILDLKWNDWCSSMELDYKPQRILPTWPNTDGISFFSSPKNHIKARIVKHQLRRIIRQVSPMLSLDRVSENRTTRLHDMLQEFRADVKNGTYDKQT